MCPIVDASNEKSKHYLRAIKMVLDTLDIFCILENPYFSHNFYLIYFYPKPIIGNRPNCANCERLIENADPKTIFAVKTHHKHHMKNNNSMMSFRVRSNQR